MRRAAPDPDLTPFDDGFAELRRDGGIRGRLRTTVGTFWSPSRPLSRRSWVWFDVVWSDGTRENPFEDYPPWTYVTEVLEGHFDWEGTTHAGEYEVVWLEGDEQRRQGENWGT
ncbi:MAG: hypothetical protein ACT4QF_01265 [Sporichthyaceae bacterium]